MDLNAKINDGNFQNYINRLALVTKKETKDEFVIQTRSLIKNVIEITPPSNGSVKGLAARKAGENKISSDLGGVFVPVKLKRKFPEKWPDVSGIHKARFFAKGNRSLSRGRAQAFYVDESKLRSLRSLLFKRIGVLASGFVPALLKLGGTAPAWIMRHGGRRGFAVVNLQGNKLSLIATNITPNGAPDNEMIRRINKAMQYQENRILRQINYLLTKNTRR